MTKKFKVIILFFLLFSFGINAAFSETAVYHGADSVFSSEGIAIFWAILKNKEADSSDIYIEIAKLESGGNSKKSFMAFSLLAADVFSGEQKYIIKKKVLGPYNLIKEEGKAFDTMSKRRFLFYTKEKPDENNEPDMEIYYLGVPDATPEFLKEEQIDKFFKDTLLRLKKAKK